VREIVEFQRGLTRRRREPSAANARTAEAVRCRATGEVVKTLDPGRALVTGACRDIGKIKAPVLRGLGGRAPYFHNGSATTLMEVVEFYNARFQIRLAPQEKSDLVAFLSTL
jgi:cytochrome c peroxidase